MLISAHNLEKRFSDNVVFQDIELTIEDGCKYGLLGVNGAGKSTLISVLLGELECEKGEIFRKNEIKIGYLKQNSGLDRNGTVICEMRKAFDDVTKAESDMRQIEEEMAALETHDGVEYRRLAAAYSAKQAYIDSRNGYSIDVKIKTVLNGMGFSDFVLDTPIDTLSGGEKTRLAIARLLLEEPELLVLDEPTNHLDFKTLNWLEDYLMHYKGALFVVSHDRYFMDKTVGHIFELENKKLNFYKGNYSSYLVQKQERYERLLKEYEAQQAEIARLESYAEKNIARASTSASAKSRLKALDAMEIIENPEYTEKKIRLRFEKVKDSYKDVLSVRDMAVAVGDENKILCRHLNMEIKKGEKVAIIGDNGIGKSSFFKTLLGIIPKYEGEFEWGKNVSISYYEQENTNLDPEKQAIDELWDRFPQITETQIRKMLGSVLLTKDDVYKKVKVISGGEKARLSLCVIMMEKSNVLLLDEPTNHLDLNSKEVLESALTDFEGTVIFISHDRYLLNKVPDKIIRLDADGAVVFDGNYDYYYEKTNVPKQSADVKEPKEKKKSDGGHRTKEERRAEAEKKQRIREIEERISYLENEASLLESELSAEEVYSNFELSREKSLMLESVNNELDELFEEWESLSE